MFAVVEWAPENEASDSPKFHTCIAHTYSEKLAEIEKADQEADLEPGFEYEVIQFDQGEECPKCGRTFQF